MTARAFSIPTIVPLTTAPSCGLPPWVKASSSIFAKASRVGVAELLAMAMNSPRVRLLRKFRAQGRSPAGLSGSRQSMAARRPSDRNDDCDRAPSGKRSEQAQPPMTEPRSAALPACSDGLDDIAGGPESAGYSQTRGVEPAP